MRPAARWWMPRTGLAAWFCLAAAGTATWSEAEEPKPADGAKDGAAAAATADGKSTPAPAPAVPWRAVPRLLVTPVFGQATDLLWRNGESLAGSLVAADPAGLSWKSDRFTGPLRMDPKVLDSIRFSTALLDREGEFQVTLLNGGAITGFPEKADADTLTLRTGHFGTIVVRQDRIVSMERVAGPGILAAGPQALLKGVPGSGGNNVPTPWYFAAAGRVASPVFNQGMKLPVKLPEKCHAELVMRCEGVPTFSMSLGVKEGACLLECWGDELVLSDGENFSSAGKVFGPDDRSAHLRVTWDRSTGKAVLYHADGRVLAELAGKPAMPPPDGQPVVKPEKPKKSGKSGGLLGLVGQLLGVPQEVYVEPEREVEAPIERGFVFQNKGAGVLVDQFSVTEWNGAPLPALKSGIAAVETAEAQTEGVLTKIEGEKATFKKPDGADVEVPLASVLAVRWNRTATMDRDPSQTEYWYADGDFIRGTLVAGNGEAVKIQTDFAEAPLEAKAPGSRWLRLPSPTLTEVEKKAVTPLERLDVLAVGKWQLHGTIKPSGTGPLPPFQPVGALEPVAPAAAAAVVLTWVRPEPGKPAPPPDKKPEQVAEALLPPPVLPSRAKPSTPPTPRPPALKRDMALLHLRGKESLPVKLNGVTRDKVEFSWAATETRELPTADVQALQFPGPVLGPTGFDSPVWTAVGSAGQKPVREGTSIVLAPNAGVSHPFIMQGSGFSFQMKRREGQGLSTIRVKLETMAGDRASGDTSFLIGDFGGTIYCGQETSEGQMNSQEEVSAPNAGNVIRIENSDPKNVQLYVNDVLVCTAVRDAKNKKKRGTGVIIESASLWGNSVGTTELADFQSGQSRFLAAPPSFAEDAKKEALLVPRLRRDDPPRQILIGLNGDLLRGEIEAMTSTHLAFRAGIENFKVPLDRVAAAVWVKKPDPSKPAKSGKSAEDSKEEAAEKPAAPEGGRRRVILGNGVGRIAKEAGLPTEAADPEKAKEQAKSGEAGPQWIDLTNGGRIALKIGEWSADTLTGTHPLLGVCRIPMAEVDTVSISVPVITGAQALLSDWTLELTPDPVLPAGAEGGGDGGGASPMVGKKAENFKLPLMEGGEFVLESQKGKVVVLDFWASWCGPCVKGLPGLITAMGEFPPDQVAFVGVNQGETKDTVKKFLTARGLNFSVAMDADQKAASKYGVEGIPHTVVVGPEGNVAFVKTGYTEDGDKQIADAVKKALASGGVSTAPAPAPATEPAPAPAPAPAKEAAPAEPVEKAGAGVLK
ncbi:MAG: hypothetical protein JWL81_1223 [Verrucomicrobiales bacterium]|nr:hypothetical protein [Verrucomicrobiales bacterium]